ncbi:hypothetical protein [Hyphomicrobium sp.]|uniref:hypothetical protein n=1 Tax=Hyphomicrobium sp. TaxID=82 RepID=UPI002E322964|nr:hypothetical protein [Hyphomicrobium sp.]HEX2843181.1 hypothetical protein [Hyphomicrobium sp.]
MTITHRPLLRRIAWTLAALAVYRAGGWIPLPGIDVNALAGRGDALGAIDRISIMALGIIPMLSAMVVVEVALTLIPRARAWASVPRNRARLDGWIVAGALVMAGLQASGIAVAFESLDGLVQQPGPAFHAGVVASLVAGTAIAMWLASAITRHGVGYGVWILVAAPHAISLLQALIVQAALWGPASPFTIAFSIGYLALCIAVLTVLAKAVPPLASTEDLLWTPVVAYAVANWLLAGTLLLRWLVLPAGQTGAFDQIIISEGAALMPIIAIALVVFLRRRSLARPWTRFDRASAVFTALALMGLVIAGGLLAQLPAHPLFPSPATALILAAVGLAIVQVLPNRGANAYSTQASQIPPVKPI